MVRIVNDVPMPIRQQREPIPWKDMEIGSSFWSDDIYIRDKASKAGKRYDMKFTCHVEGAGVRVFRKE